jgi:AcrR family transcriptional regulator
MDTEADSSRRADLLKRLVEYSKTHGLSDMSLRPLAAAVGSSPRVLLYFFGSKEGLIQEVHGELRREQLDLVARSVRAEPNDPVESVRALWTWLSDPAHADVERFFFESYARSLHGDGGPWARFGETSVREWLPHITTMLGRKSFSPTLVLAAVRGLLLDLLATGERERVQEAFDELLRAVARPAVRR